MATILEKVFDWYFGPILRQKVWTEFRTEIFDHFLTKLLDIIISQSFEQNVDQIFDQSDDINFNQCLVQNWLANLDQHSRTTIWDNILEKNWVQTFLQRIDLEICPKILSNNWSKLIRIWSLVLDRHIFQISALYLNFEGAKNIQLVAGLWYTHVPNWGSLSLFQGAKNIHVL